jgi:hypothetical protein
VGKKSSPKPPDYSATAKASEKSAELAYKTSQEQLAWAKEQWAEQKATLDQIMSVQLPMMEEQWAKAKEDRQRYEELYQPMEEEYLKRAQEWDSPERRAQEAAKAQTDISQQFDAQRQNALQRLESYGVDPSQTRNAALDMGVRIEQAKAMSQGATQARNQVEREGLGMIGESINVGRGMASQGLNYAGQSLAAGQGGQNSAAGWQGAAGAMGSPTQWMGLGQQGTMNSANIKNMGYQNQMQGWQANQDASNAMIGNVAGIAGAAAMFMADGGEVRGPGGPREDAIPARLSDGEYIIPADVVARKGTEFFDNLVKKAQESEAARMESAQVTKQALGIPPPEAMR